MSFKIKPHFAKVYLESLFSQPKIFLEYFPAFIKKEPVPVQKSKILSYF